MSKNRLKLILAFVVGVIGLMLAWWGLSGLMNLAAYFQEGADPAQALNIVPNVPPDWHSAVNWLPDDPDTGREMEPFTRTQIESAYQRAWLQWHLSYLRGEPYGLKTYFTGPAFAGVSDAVANLTASGYRLEQTDTEHTLKLHFYSADGSIVSFTDYAARTAQIVFGADENVILRNDDVASYEVVMLLEDGNWRVRHWRRGELISAQDIEESLEPEPAFVVDGGHIGQRTAGGFTPFTIHGINYYPQDTPWDLFWLMFDETVVDADFARIRALGLNTVRIFIPYEAFGGPEVDEVMLGRFSSLLEIAEENDLFVIPTLFDFFTGYSLLQWGASDRHVEGVVEPFADSSVILAWDIKNEPDLDFDAAGAVRVEAWLAHTLDTARTVAPNHLYTVGWSNAADATALADQVDIVTFHDYLSPDTLGERIAGLQGQVGNVPVVLGEFGLSTWNSPFFPFGRTETEQAVLYGQTLDVTRETGLAGTLAWTLYDFSHVPASVTGRLPWRRAPQGYFGVIDGEGREKPAAAFLHPEANIPVPEISLWGTLVKPFNGMVLLGVLVVVGGGVFFFRRKR